MASGGVTDTGYDCLRAFPFPSTYGRFAHQQSSRRVMQMYTHTYIACLCVTVSDNIVVFIIGVILT